MSKPIIPGGAFAGAVVSNVPATKTYVETAVAAYLVANPPVSSGGGGSSVAWSAITGKPSTFPASTHSHVESDVTSLVSDLAAKANAVHTHAQTDITGLTTALSGKASTTHTHVVADVSGLGTAAAKNITVSTSAPSGGSDGDIWIVVP